MPDKDYSKGKIYRIWCITGECDDVYIGSTIQSLAKRWGGHKHKSTTEKGQQRRIYQAIADNWAAWKIELIELCPCASRMELERREGELIREMGTLNTNIAGRTDKEYYEQNKEKRNEYLRQYREQNKEKAHQYHEQNKEKRNEYSHQYREQNKEKIKEQARQYSEQNKEKRNEQQRQYRARKKAEKNRSASSVDIF